LSRTARKKQQSLSKNPEFINFRSALARSKRVLISTHQLPDGDGLGAQIALFHYLKRGKKSVRIYNPDPLPPRYRFLDPEAQYISGPDDSPDWKQFDLWVIVDTNDPRRLGPLWQELSLRAKQIVFLDHHPEIESEHQTLPLPPHASVVLDEVSSSIGEMLHHLFSELELTPLTRDMALGLYVSVMTDTNSFRYARTTPAAHHICAEMIRLGVNPEEVYQAIYSSKELSHLQLLGKMLSNTKTTARGKIAWLEMPLSLRREHRASADDTQSFLSLLLMLRDAEVVCLFREEDNGTVRVSIKSKGRVVINRVAMEVGGGGHEFAAGAALTLPIEAAVKGIIRRLEKSVREAQPKKRR
jgi:phosphoesterase RecJ-like protein